MTTGKPQGGGDGRKERALRTSRALVEAYLEAARRHRRVPSVAEVVALAGVSSRTLFERFGTLNRLAAAAIDYALDHRPPPPTPDMLAADRPTRIALQVRVRAEICETWSPLWRLMVRARGGENAAGIEERILRIRGLARQRLTLFYRAELGALDEAEREALLLALEGLTEWENWDRLREEQKLSFEQACAVWTRAVNWLLAGAARRIA